MGCGNGLFMSSVGICTNQNNHEVGVVGVIE